MAYLNGRLPPATSQFPSGTVGGPRDDDVATAIDSVPCEAILQRLQQYRWTGRKGHNLSALWRAYLASFLLNFGSTNDLIRQLEKQPELARTCGFTGQLPSRWTFNRFIRRLSDHSDLVERALTDLTAKLADSLPGFGEAVAVDSTYVRVHSNGNRTPWSDPEARWGYKNSAQVHGGKKILRFGYRLHAIADAKWGIPITGLVTSANIVDMTELPSVLAKAKDQYPWFRPRYVIGDRGYDSKKNFDTVVSYGAAPVILMRRNALGGPKTTMFSPKGAPKCMGGLAMVHVKSDATLGHLYRCPEGGCHLKTRRGVRYCYDDVWIPVSGDPRFSGRIGKDSPEWNALYNLRQSIERLFKSLKESRRLERHCVRGRAQIVLHIMMAVLAYQATALVHVQAGRLGEMRWMVKKVA